MASHIEIQYLSGESETRPLTPRNPLTIGSNSSCDVSLDEDSVEPEHCEITWNSAKERFEVVAGSNEGVEVNGQIYKQKSLKSGDIISVGSVDIKLHIEDVTIAPGRQMAEQDYVMSQIFDESQGDDEEPPAAKPSPGKAPAANSPAARTPEARPEKTPARPEAAAPQTAEPSEPALSALERVKARVRESDKTSRKRPGEQDTARSPFVLGLGGWSILLAVTVVVLYFVIGRQSAERARDAAHAEREKQQYTVAILLYEKFQEEFPTSSFLPEIRMSLAQTRVQKEIEGASPNYRAGLEQLNDLILKHRDDEDFEAHKTAVREYAEKIALGSAQIAFDTASQDYLDLSEEGEKVFLRYIDSENPPQTAMDAIAVKQKEADAEIFKRNRLDQTLAEIQKHLDQKPPRTLEALDLRRKIVEQYESLRTDKKVLAMSDKLVQTEIANVRAQDVDQEAIKEDRARLNVKGTTLVFSSRSRTDEQSTGRTVLGLAKDTCYAVDSITVQPVWRRVIGEDAPFFPIEVESPLEGILLFDTNYNELILLNRVNGALVWRQPVEGRPTGAPLVAADSIYLPTTAKHLYKLHLGSGKISHRLTFGQPILAPPMLIAENNHLIVAGNAALLYTVQTNPLQCVAISDINHKPGSIETEMLRLGKLLLIVENDQAESARLRVMEFASNGLNLQERDNARVLGAVFSNPVIRGNLLIVPSGEERINAFTVTTSEKRVLTKIGDLQVEEPIPVPMFLTPGPDGLVWVGGSALRRFQITPDNVSLGKPATAAGLYTQPLQSIGERMYIGRMVPYGSSTMLTRLNREAMEGFGSAILGTRILAVSKFGDASLLAVTEAGHVFRLNERELLAGGFKTEMFLDVGVLPQPNVKEELAVFNEDPDPLEAVTMPDGRIVVYTGMPRPRVWHVTPGGEAKQLIGKMESALEARPIAIAAGVILPLPGRLQIARTERGSPIPDFIAEAGQDAKARWTQLIRLDDKQFVAANDKGQLFLIQYRTGEKEFLAQAGTFDAGAPIDYRMAVSENKLVVADANSRLRALDPLTWEILSETPLPAPAANDVWVVDGVVYVETEGNQLQAYTLSPKLTPVWPAPFALPGRLSGAPLKQGNELLLTTVAGDVLLLDGQGQPVKHIPTEQAFVTGPELHLGHPLATTLDGSIYLLDQLLQVETVNQGGN